MRRITPVLLNALVVGLLGAVAFANVPSRLVAPQAAPVLKTDAALIWESSHTLFGEPLNPHPFATEFYIHDFAAETTAESRPHSRWISPVSNAASGLTSAASGLSKKVANLRRALVRVMP